MTVILLRHGRSTSNTAHVLAGRSEGVDLDDRGREQADALVGRLSALPIRALVTSPLLRCVRTIEPLAAALSVEPVVDERLSEVDYGQWTGRKLGDLVKEPLWKVVQAQPSAVQLQWEGWQVVGSASTTQVNPLGQLAAVQLTGLSRSGQPGTTGSVLRASGPVPPLGAELLILDPATQGQIGAWS